MVEFFVDDVFFVVFFEFFLIDYFFFVVWLFNYINFEVNVVSFVRIYFNGCVYVVVFFF